VSGDRRVGRHAELAQERVTQDFQQDTADRLRDGLGPARQAPDLRQPDGDPAAEHLREHRQRARRDRVASLLAGEIGGVDQAAQTSEAAGASALSG
jgi:hypothetical protein